MPTPEAPHEHRTEESTPPGLSRRVLLRRFGVVGALAGVRTVAPGFTHRPAPAVATASVEGLPGTAYVSRPVETSIPFSLVGLEVDRAGQVELRTSPDGRTWTPWVVARRLSGQDEGPDGGAREDGSAWRRMSQPVWVGEARWLQVRGAPPDRLRAHLVNSVGLSRSGIARAMTSGLDLLVGPAADADATPFRPTLVTRAAWGADESWRGGEPRYADAARFAVIHHTATSNAYGPDDVPAIMRGIYHYHTQTLGWDDIGYNFVVDRFGRVFEGRAGGADRAVIGAHAAGHNDGSIGVAALGCFDDEACGTASVQPSMVQALDGLVAWKFAYHGVDPRGTTTEGSARLPTIVGHRDLGATACPGDGLYRRVRGTDPMAHRVWLLIYGFRDVSPDSPFAGDIAWAAAAGITKGCNPPDNDRFCPTEPVTRQQMAAFLHRALAGRPR